MAAIWRRMSREMSETQQAQQHLGHLMAVRIAAAAQQPAAPKGCGRCVTELLVVIPCCLCVWLIRSQIMFTM
jgi:uncharacterized protein (DUF2236 family)